MPSRDWAVWGGVAAVLTVLVGFSVASAVGSAAASSPSTTPAVTVTFTEKGLPSGTEWWVNVQGNTTNTTSTASTLTISEPAGKYVFTVGSAAAYYEAKGGSFKVGKKALSVKVSFKVPKGKTTVYEEGLPAKSKWCIDVTNVTGPFCATAGAKIHFTIAAGVYNYTLTTTAVGYSGPYGVTAREYMGPGVLFSVAFINT